MTLPAGGATTFYNSVWQATYGYNPRYVELTFEYIANAVGAQFNGPPTSQATLLNLDVHTDEKSTFPYIPFQETNSNTTTIYTDDTYDWQADGPTIQDDILFCDMIGTYSAGNTVTLSAFWTPSYTVTAGPYWGGFYGTTSDHCLTGMRTDHHQPMTYSLPKGYQWGIEQDGLLPVTADSIPGPYAQSMATYGLELSWGMNGQGGHGGALFGNGVTGGSDGSCASATTSQGTICGTDPNGTQQTCSYLLNLMLQSGMYKYMGTPPYSPTNPTGQLFILAAADACDPYLWLGLAAANSQITTQTLSTADLGDIGGTYGTYNDCKNMSGHFTTDGSYVQP